MCNCCTDGFETCVLASCFPFVLHGQNADKYNKKINPQANDVCLMESLKWLVLASCGVPGLLQYPIRQKVREMYGIHHSENCCGSDVITSLYCVSCDLVQVSRQLKLEQPDFRK
jgi:Cys-rich protein (TIGR01571 family)